jgi:hypothetical protein
MPTSEADEPPPPPLLAVIDETVPFVGGGVCYAVLSAVLLLDEAKALAELVDVIGDRKRPFHSNREGPEARTRMLAAIERIGVIGRAVVVQCGRRSQEAARAVALRTTVERLLEDGCRRVIIETRSRAQDGRDEAVILDLLRERETPGAITYTWERKTNPVLWIADAIGGAMHEHLSALDSSWHAEISQVTGLEVKYVPLPSE